MEKQKDLYMKRILLLIIVMLALFLRLYDVGKVPAGIHRDEESHGYNAFSLLNTGKDRYGESFPILFRSFGSYQPPLYTYLAVIPIKLFGNTIQSVRLVSVFFGTALVLITFFFAQNLFKSKYKDGLSLVFALIIAISPIFIYFSRLVAEGNLGVTIFVASMLFFLVSLRKSKLFILGSFLLALSTHSYYSERIIAVIFLPLFLLIYKNYFLKNKTPVIIGATVFMIMMLPHLWIATSGALTRRLIEVGYGNDKIFFLEFIKRYLIYSSPSNIFFDLGPSLNRVSPGLGPFYMIFIAPFFLGIKYLKYFIDKEKIKLLLLLIIISPIPASLTGDSYYPLRALDQLWLVALVISVGFIGFTRVNLPSKIIVITLCFILLHSLATFYVSYFVLFKYEAAPYYGNAYVSLMSNLRNYKDSKIIIDSGRDPGIGLRMAYLTAYNPLDLQHKLRAQLKSPYYSGEVELYEDYDLGRIQIRAINWYQDIYKEQIIIGDTLAISDQQAEEHHLKLEFELTDLSNATKLRGFSTNPLAKCQSLDRRLIWESKCQGILY